MKFDDLPLWSCPSWIQNFQFVLKKLNLGTLKTNIGIFDIFGTLRKISIRTIKNQRKYDNNLE